MRNIKPSESLVMQEYERLATEKGWLVSSQAKEVSAAAASTLRKELNSLASMLPHNVSLAHMLPVKEGADLRRAAEVVRHAASRDERLSHDNSSYMVAMAMADDEDPVRAAEGFRALRELLSQAKAGSSGLVSRIQAQLVSLTGLPVAKGKIRVDGLWGPMTATAWNYWVDQKGPFGANTGIKKVDPRGREVPDMNVLLNALAIMEPESGTPAGTPSDMPTAVPEEHLPSLPQGAKPSARKAPTSYGRLSQEDQRKVREMAATLMDKGMSKEDALRRALSMVSSVPADDKEHFVVEARRKPSGLVSRVQAQLIAATGLPVTRDPAKPTDGLWGPLTARAWNRWAKSLGDKAEALGVTMVDPQGREVPHPNVLLNALGEMEPAPAPSGPSEPSATLPEEHVPSVPGTGEPTSVKSTTPYSQLSVEDQAWVRRRAAQIMSASRGAIGMEQARRQALKELAMRKKSAAAMRELVSLANDLEEMGEVEAAMAVDRRLISYRKAAQKLYDVTGETGEDLIGQAHPGGGPVLVPAKDEGGKVETIIEEQKKSIEKATRPPTGKHAFVAQRLVALANRLDREGKTEAALLVDRTLYEMRRKTLPFVEAETVAEFLTVSAAPDPSQAQPFLKHRLWVAGQLAPAFQNLDDLVDTTSKYVRIGTYSPLYRVFLKMKGIAQNLSRTAAALPPAQLVARLVSLVSFMDAFDKSDVYEFFGSSDVREWRELLANSHKQLVQMQHDLKQKKPAKKPEVSKKRAPAKKKAHFYVRQYHKVLDAIIEAIDKGQRSLTGEKEWKEFPKGEGGALAWQEWARKAKTQPVTPQQALKYLRYFRNSPDSPLKALKRMKLAAALHIQKLEKTAQPPASPAGKTNVPQGMAAPPGSPGASTSRRPTPRRGKGRRKREDPNVGQLQKALQSLGISIGKPKPDSQWGPLTHAGWEELRKRLQRYNVPLASASPDKQPSEKELQDATRYAQRLRLLEKRLGARIELAPGVTVSESQMGNPRSFLRALAKANVLSDPKRLGSRKNLTQALELLRSYWKKLDDPAQMIRMGPEALKKQKSLVVRLARALRTAAVPRGYGMPEERKDTSSVSKPSKPPVRREPVERGPFGKGMVGNVYDQLKMALPSQRMLEAPEVFIPYAVQKNPRSARMRMEGKTDKAIALNYIEKLRRDGANYFTAIEQNRYPELTERQKKDLLSDLFLKLRSLSDLRYNVRRYQ